MGFLDDFYVTEQTVSADFQQKTSSKDNLTGVVTESFESVLVVEGLFWNKTMVERYVSERYRSIVEGAFVMNYEDYTVTVNNDAKVTIGSKDYSVIYVDNIAEQNEIVFVPLKEYT